MTKQLVRIAVLFLALAVKMAAFGQTVDTVIDGKHYNTVIKYHNFDYKGEKEDSFITAYGNMKDSVKDGKWMYVWPNGDVLAVGKFKNGYKTGDWKYRRSDGKYFIVTWRKSERVRDYVRFESNTNPQLVDFNSAEHVQLEINGYRVYSENFIRFL